MPSSPPFPAASAGDPRPIEPPLDWLPLPCSALEITADALVRDGVRAALTLGAAEQIVANAASLDGEGRLVSLPTREILDLAFRHARFQPPPGVVEGSVPAWPGFPCPLRSAADPLAQRSRRIDRWLMREGWGPRDLIAPIGLHWVIGADGSQRSGYGWEARDGAYHSQVATGDDRVYWVRLVRWRVGVEVPGLRQGTPVSSTTGSTPLFGTSRFAQNPTDPSVVPG